MGLAVQVAAVHSHPRLGDGEVAVDDVQRELRLAVAQHGQYRVGTDGAGTQLEADGIVADQRPLPRKFHGMGSGRRLDRLQADVDQRDTLRKLGRQGRDVNLAVQLVRPGLVGQRSWILEILSVLQSDLADHFVCVDDVRPHVVASFCRVPAHAHLERRNPQYIAVDLYLSEPIDDVQLSSPIL